jgi:phosphohistidine phosphatase
VRVFIVRHAEAAPGEPDELRPLTRAGRATARALGERLAAEDVAAVRTSPLRRARETAEPIAAAAGVEAHPDERLAPGATVDDVRAVVAETNATTVLVGHQPDCGNIALALTGRPHSFPPGGFAEFEL